MVDITDIGRVLNAMLSAVNTNCYGESSAATVMATALRAGAAKCAEIAKEQLADAAPMQPATNGWIEHTSNNRPVPVSTKVDVEFYDGSLGTGFAADFEWHSRAIRNKRINRYRIIDRPEQTS